MQGGGSWFDRRRGCVPFPSPLRGRARMRVSRRTIPTPWVNAPEPLSIASGTMRMRANAGPGVGVPHPPRLPRRQDRRGRGKVGAAARNDSRHGARSFPVSGGDPPPTTLRMTGGQLFIRGGWPKAQWIPRNDRSAKESRPLTMSGIGCCRGARPLVKR